MSHTKSDQKSGSLAKEYVQPLEARKGKKIDSSLEPPEGTSLYNSLVPMCIIQCLIHVAIIY